MTPARHRKLLRPVLILLAVFIAVGVIDNPDDYKPQPGNARLLPNR